MERCLEARNPVFELYKACCRLAVMRQCLRHINPVRSSSELEFRDISSANSSESCTVTMEHHAPLARLKINVLPNEVVYEILAIAADLNSREGVAHAFGRSRVSTGGSIPEKCVGAPVSPDWLRWDNTCAIRQVCSSWHAWALNYALRDIYI